MNFGFFLCERFPSVIPRVDRWDNDKASSTQSIKHVLIPVLTRTAQAHQSMVVRGIRVRLRSRANREGVMARALGHAGYSIAAVSKLAGVSCHALRVWERRYGFPVPERSS